MSETQEAMNELKRRGCEWGRSPTGGSMRRGPTSTGGGTS